MKQYENDCVGCEVCVGCGRKRTLHIYCDKCGAEDTIYYFDDEELCIDCIEDKLEKVSD